MRRLVVALIAVASVIALAPAATAADVHGDDEADQYVGTGGLILPSTVGWETRTEVASCSGCEWRLTSPCVESDAGIAFSGTPTCLSVTRGCADMSELLRGWFRPEGGPWRQIGLLCVRESGPTTVADIGLRVRERLVSALPATRPTFQPARGVVTQLPVIFASGQDAGGVADTLQILGQSVTIEAVPRWSWDFGDGSRLATAKAGGTYPDAAVAHVYRASRSYRVGVVTDWSAQFTVDGLGPFPVTDPVTQAAQLTVSVGEGRAVLATR